MKGLKNIGNTCYLNSALQMVLNIPDLCNLITTHSHLSSNLKLISDFIKEYYNGENKVLIPLQIKELVGKRKKMFGGYGQNDSSEFMIFLFDIINEDLTKSTKIKPGWIYDIIGIKTNINIKCKLVNCLATSEHIENDMFLYLPITKSLTESYRIYKTNEKLCGDNKYFCEKCQKKTIARKRVETELWPNNLIIVLKRFDNMLKKNTNKMNIPLEWRHGYKLVGGIIHSGNLQGGHYYYFGIKNNKWYVFNDSHVSIINSQEELQRLLELVYIINYKK